MMLKLSNHRAPIAPSGRELSPVRTPVTATAAKLPSPFRGGSPANTLMLFRTGFHLYRGSVRHSPPVSFADSPLPEGAFSAKGGECDGGEAAEGSLV